VAKKYQVAVEKLRKAIIASLVPLQPSARNTSVPAGQIFVNSFIKSFLLKFFEKNSCLVTVGQRISGSLFMSSLVTNAKEPEVLCCADFDSECVHCVVRTEAEGAVEHGTCNAT